MTRVTTRDDTTQHEYNTSITRGNTTQHEYNTRQHEYNMIQHEYNTRTKEALAAKIGLYIALFVTELNFFLISFRNS